MLAVPIWTPAFSRDDPKPVPCVALFGGEFFDGGRAAGFGLAAGVLGAFVAVTLGLTGILKRWPYFYLDC